MDHLKQNVNTLIVVVNWRSPWDSLECLESLLQQSRNDWAAVVIDNASGDQSMDIFEAWAEGKLCGIGASVDSGPKSPNKKYAEIRPMVKFLAFDDFESRAAIACQDLCGRTVFFVRNNVNGGFAAGNNVGLKIANHIKDLKWLWLLNNDTVVDRDALDWLARKSEKASRNHIVGASVMEYYDASCVQYNGGASYSNFSAMIRPLKFQIPSNKNSLDSFERNVESKLSYIVGASMFMSVKTFVDIGFMKEDYFLYYEELDWLANKREPLDLLYASKAIVYHKEGGATGGKTNSQKKNFTAEYYSARARVLYTLRYKKFALFFIVLLQIGAIARRIFRDRNAENAKIVLRAVLDAFSIYGGKKSGGRV